jgi:ATP-dependent protease ClpP protease subunit
LIVPNSGCRANPDRCILIDGRFDDQLLSRVTPTILKLQKTRGPITVYILNSPGGGIRIMESLLRLLRAPDQDFFSSRRIITVATKRAASAAADLLCSGDYAIAYPDSTIHYHGGRVYEESALTKERTNLLAEWLRWTTDYYAWDLARKIENRFRLRFLLARDQFADIRTKHHPQRMSDFDCFLEIIMEKLSDKGKEVCKTARDRYKRYEALLTKMPRPRKSKRRRPAILEAAQIKVILDFELRANKKNRNWTFRYGGLGKLTEDFYLLAEYLESKQDDRLSKWCSELGKLALSPAEKAAIDAIQDEQLRTKKTVDLVRPIIEPVWSFFIALCHSLQEGENALTAKDAYWLGLIDEVLGEPDMSALRWIMEYQDDPTPAAAQATDSKAGEDAKKDKAETKANDPTRPETLPV